MRAVRAGTRPMSQWALLVRAFGAIALLVVGARAQAAEWASGVTVTSDYVFRGITQTRGNPALQIGTNLSADNGFYLWGWTTNVKYAGLPAVDLEVDYGAGWYGEFGEGWALDVSISRYHYPGDSSLDYVELVAEGTWRERIEAVLGYSHDAFATGRDGWYVEMALNQPVGEHARWVTAIGHYRLESALGASYTHGRVGMTWSLGEHVELSLLAHTTDTRARTLFGDDAGTRAEAMLDIAF